MFNSVGEEELRVSVDSANQSQIKHADATRIRIKNTSMLGFCSTITEDAGLTFYFKCVLTTIRNVSGCRYL
jgi:hypothetical protein